MSKQDEGRTSFQITKSALVKFKAACDSRAVGRTMYDAGSRLIEWFCQQTPILQTIILSDIDTGMEQAYADQLVQIVRELRRKNRRANGETESLTVPERVIQDIAAENKVSADLVELIVIEYLRGLTAAFQPKDVPTSGLLQHPTPPATNRDRPAKGRRRE